MAQGGDFISKDGNMGESIWGHIFEDENFDLHHSKPFLVTMANRGPNTNSSQFIITFSEASWLDGRHVVFGEILDGFDVLKEIEKVGSKMGKVKRRPWILDSGELDQIN
jgi:cyclophilin family peptidyl-prolyl cis-trans isomerase